jgi:cytochrome b561
LARSVSSKLHFELNTDIRAEVAYDPIAQAVHWLVAALAVGVVLLGWTIGGVPRNTPQRGIVILLHESVGLTILAAMVFRACWRWRHPPPPLVVSRLEAGLAWLTHMALYVLLIFMPLAGYWSIAAAGDEVSFFRRPPNSTIVAW